MKRARVVIVEDHDLIRQGVEQLLGRIEWVTLAGGARTVAEGLGVLKTVRPDVVLVDLGLPDGSGLGLIKAARLRWPDLRVIVLSSREDADAVGTAFAAGAASYLTKSGPANELAKAIEAALQGRRYITPRVAETLAQWVASPEAPALNRLSPRQCQILRLVAEGHTTKAIASLLSISITTVNTHRAEIIKRLGIGDVATLTRFAIESGLIERKWPR